MKHRGRISLAIGFCFAFALAGSAVAQQDQQDTARRQAQVGGPSELQIWKAIIHDSIAAYPHACPCPYSPNRAGRACGDRSAYSRGAGASGRLICYIPDIPDDQIARYRERMQ